MPMKKLRPKPITEAEFRLIKERKWQPVELSYDILPKWMKEIPVPQRVHVYASGGFKREFNQRYGGYEVGGMDVFRNARGHPEQVNWNKDHYVIIRNPKTNDSLLMYGPFRDHEHWINYIPNRLEDVEILTYDNVEFPTFDKKRDRKLS